MDLDHVLVNYVGEFGRYQVAQIILLMVPCVFVSIHSVSWTFTGAMVDHRCRVQGELKNVSYFLSTVSQLADNTSEALEKLECWYDPTVPSENSSNSHKETHLVSSTNWTKCREWIYDRSEISYSAVDRWDVVCDRKPLRATVQSMYYIGQAVGSILFGYIGDRFGRKVAFILASSVLCVSGILMSVVPWLEMFAALRLLVGLAHPGVFVVAVIIGMELVGPMKRSVGSLAANLAFSIGQICLAGAAYMLRNYQHLQLAISLPCLVFVAYGFLMPRSVRWLISQGRHSEAEHVLRRAAKINGRHLPNDWHNGTAESLVSAEKSITCQDRRYSFVDLFRTRNIRKWALVQFFCWPTVSMVYYGIAMEPSFMGGDRYITFLISAFIELPGVFLAAAGLNRLGRKMLMIIGFVVAGTFMMVTLVIPGSQKEFVIACVAVAKMAITMVYTVIYAWTPELFPTVIRNQATGVCSMMARIGGVAASYMVMLLAYHSRAAVAVTFGSLSFMAAFLCMFQPETAGSKTLETIEEAERFGNRAKFWSFRAPQMDTGDTLPELAANGFEKPLLDGKNRARNGVLQNEA